MPCSLNANQPSGWTVSVTGTSSGISVMWRRSGETCSPEDGERRQLLKVKREVQAETGLKESSDGLWGERGLLSLCRRHSTHMLHTPGNGSASPNVCDDILYRSVMHNAKHEGLWKSGITFD